MKVVTELPNGDLREAQALARKWETIGMDGVLTGENRHGPFMPLAVSALVTDRIELATGVAIAFPRAPLVTAMDAWDVHTASHGRFNLGLGPQIKQHNERRYGIAWSPPAPRMRDYVGAVRAIWRCWEGGEPLDYSSAHYRLNLMPPHFSPRPNGFRPPPVSLAGVGPAMLRLAGEVGDGARLHPFHTRKYLEETIVPRIDEGLARAGRDRAELEVIADTLIATGPDEEAVQKARQRVRHRIAFYSSTPAYWPVLEAHGLEDLGHKLIEYPRAGRWDEMADEVPEDLIDLFAVSGTWDTIAEGVAERYAGLLDSVCLPQHPDVRPGREDRLAEALARIRRIPTRFRAHRDFFAWGAPAETGMAGSAD